MADRKSESQVPTLEDAGRRDFLKGSVALGAGAVGLAAMACRPGEGTSDPAGAKNSGAHGQNEEGLSAHVPPGKLDD